MATLADVSERSHKGRNEMAGAATGKRWTATFDRIPEEKRRRVLESAKRAFARHGFAGTNVNLVASDAGISVGSLYQYFRTKEDIFLALIEHSHSLLAAIIDEIFTRETTFLGRVEAILTVAVDSSLNDPELLNLYIACTTEELGPMAAKLSSRIESVAAHRYREMVGAAIRSGEIRPDADPASVSFCLDNLFLIVQFSFGSAYYRERLALFLGRRVAARPREVIDGVMDFIRHALLPGPR
jgi:TetR/AcrR family transcriptional regulator